MSLALTKQFLHDFQFHCICKPKKANTQNYFMTFKVTGYMYTQQVGKEMFKERNELQ